MKPTRNRFVRLISLSAITLLGSHSAQAATSTWNTTASAANWLTAGNWLGGVPGVNDIGLFNGAVNPVGGQVGFGASAAFGAISLSGTASSITFGSINNGGTRAITLNGTTVDTVANTILSNKTSSPTTLSLISTISGNKSLEVTLGNTTNVIQVTPGNTISIQVALAQANLLSGISLQGGGKLILFSGNTYTGTTDVQAGTLELGANDVFANTSTIQISGGILDTTASNRTDTVSVFKMSSGSLNGGGTITATTYGLSGGTVTGNLGTGTLNSSGTVALNGTAGATTVNVTAGTLTLGSANRLADGATVAVSGGTLAMGANTDTVSIFNMSSGAITGTGPLTATTYGLSGGTVTGNLGTGTLNSSGTVALNGTAGATAVNITAGTLTLGSADRLDNGATVAVSGGTLAMGANTDTVSIFNMSSGFLNGTGTITAGTYGLSGGTVNANLGTGTLNVTGTVALNGTSAASAVNVSSGSLTLGSANRLANAAAVAVSGGALAIAGFDDTVGAVSLTTGGSITGSGGTLTGSSYAVQSGSISAKLGGAGIGLTKTTAGTVSLSGANNYTGATTIQAGTLQLLTGGSLASLSIIVGDTGSTSAVLDAIATGLLVASGQTVSGIGTIQGNTTIQSAGAIAPGNSPGILTNLGNMTLASGSDFQAEINGTTVGTGYDQLNVTGVVSLAGLLNVTTGFTPTVGSLFFLIDNDGPSAISGVFSNAPLNGNTYTFGSQQYAVSYFGNYDTTSFTGGNDVVLMAVPEPGAALLGGVGLLCLMRRRRNA